MELDIKPADLEELKSMVSDKLTSINLTERDQSQLFVRIEQLESEIEILQRKMGWREKNLAGFFGGDRELVREEILKNEALNKTKEQLKKIEGQLSKQSTKLDDEIRNILTERSDSFSILQNELSLQSKLLKASKQYEFLLMKARQGVRDALIWASWETLIDHKDAKRELGKFKKETDKFQDALIYYETNSTHKIGEPVKLNKLIKFSSERIAMNCFGELLKQAKKYKKHARKLLKAIKQQEISYLNSAREMALRE